MSTKKYMLFMRFNNKISSGINFGKTSKNFVKV